MKVIDVDLSEIKPYENNPRNNDNAVQYVANSIKKFGFKVPIVIDDNYVIVAGDTRYKAAIQLGMERVPCVIASDLTEEQAKEYRIADNKSAEVATWDYLMLANEIGDSSSDFTNYGFTANEISNLLEFGEKISDRIVSYIPDDYGDLSQNDNESHVESETVAKDGKTNEEQASRPVFRTEMVMCPYCGEEFELG